jgi:dihydroorotase-like cyclic amidohydrolase
MEIGSDTTVVGHAGFLARQAAASRGVPAGLARRAERATAERFTVSCREPLDDHARRRMTAYFDAVVRRVAFRCTDPEAIAFRRRLVAASIEEDLRRAIPSSDPRRAATPVALPLALGV